MRIDVDLSAKDYNGPIMVSHNGTDVVFRITEVPEDQTEEINTLKRFLDSRDQTIDDLHDKINSGDDHDTRVSDREALLNAQAAISNLQDSLAARNREIRGLEESLRNNTIATMTRTTAAMPSDGVSVAEAKAVLYNALACGAPWQRYKIQAIKFVRSITNLGLKESKDLADGVLASYEHGYRPDDGEVIAF